MPPANVIRHDADDPYLVVAADKGTATFSDVANAIAVGRGFWLGDAFASGGGQGYDHKAMGITARGAWISVQRHFAERGLDVQTEPLSVVGVGDMSGDVFGNGMLLSHTIRLVAAFDHRHIFLDPNPDPAISFAERQRLFALPRSSWADYDLTLLSPGAMVVPRTQKAIDLSPEAQAVLGLTAATLGPSELLAAILRAPVDLLWFGGIGTYVKAARESNADVGDRANDAHRVDGEQVRAVAIGEGANLGITQAGRVAYAERGGRINTDFVDNSAGVDTSDHEVNIKIALGPVVASGVLGEADRNSLLAAMTGEVADLVLADNHAQTLALSIAEAGGPASLASHVELMTFLETAMKLDRAVEGLPPDAELAERRRQGRGLERPELAVLLAYAKMALEAVLPSGALVDDPLLARDLIGNFPRELSDRFPDAITRASAAARDHCHPCCQSARQPWRAHARQRARRRVRRFAGRRSRARSWQRARFSTCLRFGPQSTRCPLAWRSSACTPAPPQACARRWRICCAWAAMPSPRYSSLGCSRASSGSPRDCLACCAQWCAPRSRRTAPRSPPTRRPPWLTD